MKIGMILESDFPPDPRVENEAISLIEAGNVVFLLCLSFKNIRLNEIINGINVHRFYLKREFYKKLRVLILNFPLYNMLWKNKIIEFVKKQKLQALHIHDLPLIGAGLDVGQKMNIPVIVDLHENYPEALKTYTYSKTFLGRTLVRIPQWKKYERKSLPKCRAVVVLSEDSKERVSTFGIPDENIIITPNTVQLDRFLSLGIKNEIVQKYKEYFIFSYLGDLGTNRGIQNVILTLPKVLEVNSNIRLLLVGESGDRDRGKLRELVASKNLEKYVFFTGWQDYSLFPTYLEASDVCLLPLPKNPQTESGVSNKFFQYLAMGRPMIVSDCKPQKRIVQEENCGFIFQYGNNEELAQCMIKMVKDKKLRETFSRNAKKAALEKYNWKKTSQNLISFYNQLQES